MADSCSWDSIPSSGGGEMSDFLRLQSGNSYKIRPVFEPVKFFKYFHKNAGKLKTAICGKPDACKVRMDHPELKKPSLRFAAYVIDRADNKVKILEAPQSVFRPIGARLGLTGQNPGGGKDGSDWQITVTGTGLNTTYAVDYIQQTPLNQEERDLIKEALDGDKEKLKKLYKVDSAEQIEEKLFGDPNAAGSGPSAPVQAAAAPPASAPAQAAPAASSTGDDFDQEW
jgi:hypothetical protein